jgi:hypothetical protein
MHCASTGAPEGGRVIKAMRKGLGSRSSALRNSPAGFGATYRAPGSCPCVQSRIAALSRTVQLTAWWTESPPQPSVRSGPIGTRPRLGLSPNSPQHDAGMRIDPPPSVACAAGITPAATAELAPPDDPPAMREGSHGLRVAPVSLFSVVAVWPNSGEAVLPNTTKPAASIRWTNSEVTGATASR